MKKPHLYFHTYVAAPLMLAAVPAEAADVKELFAIDLADYPGKEGRLLEVSYPPGARDMVHWRDAHAFVYVLEGQIVMQLKGQPAVTLKAGQKFYEGPTDVHIVGRNADASPQHLLHERAIIGARQRARGRSPGEDLPIVTVDREGDGENFRGDGRGGAGFEDVSTVRLPC